MFDVFIVKTPTMERLNQGTVPKSRFYGIIHSVPLQNFLKTNISYPLLLLLVVVVVVVVLVLLLFFFF